MPIALHVDGIEKRRAKWGPFGRAVYALSERLACALPDALVTDAEVIRGHYREALRSSSRCSPTASIRDRRAKPACSIGSAWRRASYFLYVSRFEPENNPHRVAEAYRRQRASASCRW